MEIFSTFLQLGFNPVAIIAFFALVRFCVIRWAEKYDRDEIYFEDKLFGFSFKKTPKGLGQAESRQAKNESIEPEKA